jgi:hypothetical protein
VHHDRDRAVAGGSKDIFLNILASTGLVQRYVAEWAGPGAVVRRVAVRLGVPCYAYETLILSGRVTAREGADVTVAVVGRVSTGEHVAGTVTLRLTESPPRLTESALRVTESALRLTETAQEGDG